MTFYTGAMFLMNFQDNFNPVYSAYEGFLVYKNEWNFWFCQNVDIIVYLLIDMANRER